MRANMERRYRPADLIEQHGRFHQFETYVIPAVFHADSASYEAANTLLEKLIGHFVAEHGCCHEGFIQGQFKERASTHLFADSARRWLPEIGLGVWPNRELPRMLNEYDFENFDQSAGISVPIYSTYRVMGDAGVKLDAMRTMMGTGSTLQILGTGSSEYLLTSLSQVLLAAITDRVYRIFSLYVPLIELAALDNPVAELTADCLAGIRLYIRESWEDKGILVISRDPLAEAFEHLGCTRLDEMPGENERWQIAT